MNFAYSIFFILHKRWVSLSRTDERKKEKKEAAIKIIREEKGNTYSFLSIFHAKIFIICWVEFVCFYDWSIQQIYLLLWQRSEKKMWKLCWFVWTLNSFQQIRNNNQNHMLSVHFSVSLNKISISCCLVVFFRHSFCREKVAFSISLWSIDGTICESHQHLTHKLFFVIFLFFNDLLWSNFEDNKIKMSFGIGLVDRLVNLRLMTFMYSKWHNIFHICHKFSGQRNDLTHLKCIWLSFHFDLTEY